MFPRMGSGAAPVEELLRRWPAPAVVAGVVGPGEGEPVVWGDGAAPNAWASVTKLVTALSVLVALEEDTLDLDQPAGPPGSTVRHLLAHASGLGVDDAEVRAAPGTVRIYSNTGYAVLAETLADAAGMPFERYATEAVLEPLKMSATRLEGSAASGLIGPVDDLLRLGAELLRPTLVSADTLGQATTVAFPGLAGVLPGIGRFEPNDWGLGPELRGQKWPHWTGRANSSATFGHFGRSGTFLWVDPVAGLACAALTGRDFGAWVLKEWPVFSDAVLDRFS